MLNPLSLVADALGRVEIDDRWMHIQGRQQRAEIVRYAWLALVTLASLWAGVALFTNGPQPNYVGRLLSLALVLISVVAIINRPRYGLYFILFFGLLGDAAMMPWYPFVKNLSSTESLLFIHPSLIISPFELFVVVTTLAWIVRAAILRDINVYLGRLALPVALFTLFLLLGFGYGVGTGGDFKIALWESRAIFYLPLMLVLTSNLIETRSHVHQLMWVIMLALAVEGVIGTWYYLVTLQGNLAGIESITEHSAAIHMNTLFVFALAVWLFPGSISKRLLLPLLSLPVVLPYIATQRRAAFLTVGVALVLMGLVLLRQNRRLFFVLAPIAMVLAVGYLGVFWNSTGALGAPASAVKSVVAPDTGSADDLSNIYRVIENVNVSFTVHQAPLTGVGFGRKFYIIVPMADISFFDWWEYIVHNSIFWIWMKAGVFGFMSMIFLTGYAIMTGSRAVWRMPTGDLRAICLVTTLYVLMHFMYAYVDMSWDNQSMMYVGAMMGLVNCLEHVVSKPVARPGKRWPWQAELEAAPTILTLQPRVREAQPKPWNATSRSQLVQSARGNSRG